MAFEPINRDRYERASGQYPSYSTGEYGVPVASATPAERAAFLNKVYLSLCGGVAVSMATGFYVATQHPGLLSVFFGKGIMGFLLLFAVFIGMTFVVQKVARVPGVNLLAFGGFTAFTGLAILAPMFFVAIRTTGGYDVIWNAFGLSALVFGGLTGFVLITGKDFSFLRGTLTIGLLVLIAFMIGSFFLSMPAVHLGITSAGLLLFGLFVLYDTSVIMRAYSSDMWISGALSLFLDFINFFIRVLSLLMRGGRD